MIIIMYDDNYGHSTNITDTHKSVRQKYIAIYDNSTLYKLNCYYLV